MSFFFLLQCSLGSDDDIDGNDGGVGGGLHSHLCQLVNESWVTRVTSREWQLKEREEKSDDWREEREKRRAPEKKGKSSMVQNS